MTATKNRVSYVGREDEDPFNMVYAARLRKGKTSVLLPRTFKRGWVKRRVRPEDKRVEEPEPDREPRDKIHPVLRKMLKEGDPDKRYPLMVVFRETMAIPRFPEPDDSQPREAEINQRLLKRADELVKRISARREEGYRKQMEVLERYEARVQRSFWLINALLVEVPLGHVNALAELEDVVSIEPDETGEEPPQHMVSDGRARLDSDPYFSLGQTSGWIGLLDTGIRSTHTLYNNPSHVGFRYDMVNTGAGSNPEDDHWNHGTSSGAIITGNGNLTNHHRGVTAITLDSMKVYNNSGLVTSAAVDGFQRAINILDRVIVAEIQSASDDMSSISQAADAAFSAGAVVIAANGNFGPNAKTVRAPGNAHRAIGVGAFDVETEKIEDYSGRGPTRDNRFKPDVMCPTNTETASNTSDTDTQSFGGTSGATPFGSGVAALLRNWLRGNTGNIDPGQVYAQLILSGQKPYPFDNNDGAGHLRLPTNGTAWWGKVSVNNHDQINIPISIGSNVKKLDAALWWPEFAFNLIFITLDPHNDIDLYLIDPNGNICDSSISINSIFERAQVTGAIMPGTWKLRIHGYNVTAEPQTVYWALHAQR